MNDLTVGEQLLIARRRAGLSQSDLAKKADVSLMTVSKIESGATNFRIINMIKMASALDLQMSIDIIENTGDAVELEYELEE